MKKLISVLLIALLLSGAAVMCFAADGSIARVVIGADLTEAEKAAVYAEFGINRGAVTELTMTNELERKYLEGSVDASVIGTRSVSCVYIEARPAGSGLEVVTTDKITYFTSEMYSAALKTAGITDAKIIVTAPFQVSGTGALAGIYYAVEDLSGETIADMSVDASNQMLTVTGELAESIGDADASDIVTGITDMLGETASMTDEELKTVILAISGQYNVSLTNSQIDSLISLYRSLESLNEAGLLEKVQQLQGTIEKVSTATSGIIGFFRTLKAGIDKIMEIIGKIKGLFGA